MRVVRTAPGKHQKAAAAVAPKGKAKGKAKGRPVAKKPRAPDSSDEEGPPARPLDSSDEEGA